MFGSGFYFVTSSLLCSFLLLQYPNSVRIFEAGVVLANYSVQHAKGKKITKAPQFNIHSTCMGKGGKGERRPSGLALVEGGHLPLDHIGPPGRYRLMTNAIQTTG